MREVNVKELQAKTVDEVKAALGQLKPEQLTELAELENAADDTRSGVTEAIEAEQKQRAENADAAIKLAKETAEHAGIPLATGDEVETLQARVTAAEEKAAKAGKAKPTPAPKAPGKVRTIKLDAKAEQVPAKLAFADKDGKTSRHLPDLEFRPGQFAEKAQLSSSRGKPEKKSVLTLRADIAFDPGTTPVSVKKVFLLNDKGKAFGLCELVAPLTVGGGNAARLPADSLTFACEPQPAS